MHYPLKNLFIKLLNTYTHGTQSLKGYELKTVLFSVTGVSNFVYFPVIIQLRISNGIQIDLILTALTPSLRSKPSATYTINPFHELEKTNNTSVPIYFKFIVLPNHPNLLKYSLVT